MKKRRDEMDEVKTRDREDQEVEVSDRSMLCDINKGAAGSA